MTFYVPHILLLRRMDMKRSSFSMTSCSIISAFVYCSYTVARDFKTTSRRKGCYPTSNQRRLNRKMSPCVQDVIYRFTGLTKVLRKEAAAIDLEYGRTKWHSTRESYWTVSVAFNDVIYLFRRFSSETNATAGYIRSFLPSKSSSHFCGVKGLDLIGPYSRRTCFSGARPLVHINPYTHIHMS